MSRPVTAPSSVITSWSAVSPFGRGRGPFVTGMRAGVARVTTLDPDRFAAPHSRACMVPALDPTELLGRKGTRSMDRATALAVCAVAHLLHEDLECRDIGLDEATAVVLGTSTGSIDSIMSFVRESLTQDKPYLVDPARFPNTVMNCAAARSAIWHGLRGPNVTIAGARASALLALNHARRLLESGRAGGVVCGAVEEYSARRAWLAWHARADRKAPMLLGEGAAVVLLESAQARRRPAVAEVLAVEIGLAPAADDVKPALGACLARARRTAGVSWEDLWAVAPSDAPGIRGRHEREAITEFLGTRSSHEVSCMDVLGDTCSASGAFQICALLARAQHDAASSGRSVLVTGVDADGVVGAAVFRISPGTQP
jgi:3-oxoacyl-[acyl-carrier-protein] synthase II